ncbi:hypothetical protein ACLOJK_021994 [Asimina triloba]
MRTGDGRRSNKSKQQIRAATDRSSRSKLGMGEEKGLRMREERRLGDGSSSKLEMGGDRRWTDRLTSDSEEKKKKMEVGDPVMGGAAGGGKGTGKMEERLEAGRWEARGQRSGDGRLEARSRERNGKTMGRRKEEEAGAKVRTIA